MVVFNIRGIIALRNCHHQTSAILPQYKQGRQSRTSSKDVGNGKGDPRAVGEGGKGIRG